MEGQFNESEKKGDPKTVTKARDALLGTREAASEKRANILIAQSEVAALEKAEADLVEDLAKRNQKKQRLEKELLKDETDLQRAQADLKAVNAQMRAHQRQLKDGINDLVCVKDKALHEVEVYNQRLEDLMGKFAEEKENLALSLSDRMSKHKIAKIVGELSHIGDKADVSSIKSDVKISFTKEIASLNSTLQRVKGENRELKARNRGLLNAIDSLKQRLTESEDNVQTRELRHIIDGATEATNEAGSVGRRRGQATELKIYETPYLPETASAEGSLAFRLLEKFNTEADDPMSRSDQGVKIIDARDGLGRNAGISLGSGETVAKGKSHAPNYKEDPPFSSGGETAPVRL